MYVSDRATIIITIIVMIHIEIMIIQNDYPLRWEFAFIELLNWWTHFYLLLFSFLLQPYNLHLHFSPHIWDSWFNLINPHLCDSSDLKNVIINSPRRDFCQQYYLFVNSYTVDLPKSVRPDFGSNLVFDHVSCRVRYVQSNEMRHFQWKLCSPPSVDKAGHPRRAGWGG